MPPKNPKNPKLVKPMSGPQHFRNAKLAEVPTKVQTYDSYLWWSVVTPGELESLKMEYKVSGIFNFEIPLPDEGVVDSEGFASKVVVPFHVL